MARTAKGRALTEAHRRAQIANGALSMKKAEIVYRRGLYLNNIDSSFPVVSAAIEQVAMDGHLNSVELARNYVPEFAKAEGFEPPQAPVVGMDTVGLTKDLRVNGNYQLKAKIGAGIDPGAAKQSSEALVKGLVKQHVMSGGRNFIIEGVKYSGSSGRWRRVTDGKPCAFCAMLAGRGPVYAADTVDFEAHPACGCGVEQVVGEWQPTDVETAWIEAYSKAAKAANAQDEIRIQENVLWRMRRAKPDLFSDGVIDEGLDWVKLKSR